MLKWLGGGGNTSSGASGSSGGGNGSDNFTHVGKVFTVNEYQVVVEELIAEGRLFCCWLCKYTRLGDTKVWLVAVGLQLHVHLCE